MTEPFDYGGLQHPSGTYGSALGNGGSALAKAGGTRSGKGSGGGSGKAASPLLPVPPSPYPLPSKVGVVEAGPKDKLRTCLDALARKKPYLRLALADLTGVGEGEVPYVGYRDDELTFVGSTAKISLILPAFSLRHAAREAAALLKSPLNPTDFFNWLDKAWDQDFRRGFLGGAAADTKPQLRSILTAVAVPGKPQLKIDFTMNQDRVLAKAGFRPRLILAEQLSVNEAAAYCIRDVGFPFIHEVHRAARIDGVNGLSLGLDYGGRSWGGSMPRNEHATARWLAELLVVIARDRLVTRGLASEIHDVMATDLEDLAIGINNQLTTDEGLSLTQQGKVGYIEKKKGYFEKRAGKDGPYADCGIIRRTTAKGKELFFVAVALNGKSHADIGEVGAALDDCILAAHGQPLKSVNP